MVSGPAPCVTFKTPLQGVLQAHTESLSSVSWLVRVDYNETVVFGYFSKFQSFIKPSESQKSPPIISAEAKHLIRQARKHWVTTI